jgi:hypothetical protein
MGCRNSEKGKKAIDEMPEACKGKNEIVLIDVTD